MLWIKWKNNVFYNNKNTYLMSVKSIIEKITEFTVF